MPTALRQRNWGLGSRGRTRCRGNPSFLNFFTHNFLMFKIQPSYMEKSRFWYQCLYTAHSPKSSAYMHWCANGCPVVSYIGSSYESKWSSYRPQHRNYALPLSQEHRRKQSHLPGTWCLSRFKACLSSNHQGHYQRHIVLPVKNFMSELKRANRSNMRKTQAH